MPFVTPRGLEEQDVDQTKINSKLFVSAWQGDEEATLKYIKMGGDVNFQHTSGYTCAHQAAKFQHIGILLVLIEHGADLTIRDHDNYTPLELLTDSELTNLLSVYRMLQKTTVNPEHGEKWAKAHQLIVEKLDENQRQEAEYERLESERMAALSAPTWEPEGETTQYRDDYFNPGETSTTNTTRNVTASYNQNKQCQPQKQWFAPLLMVARAGV